MRKSKKRIHGNDRAYMMLARDVRRRWLQYGENRTNKADPCIKCGAIPTQADHVKAIGKRPRKPEDFSPYIDIMFNRKCQPLCKSCHKEKTNAKRKKSKTITV